MTDQRPLNSVAARYVVAPRDSLRGDDREVVRVRRVVAADDDYYVQRMLQEPHEGVLSVLCSRTDGVEELEVLPQILFAIARSHCLPQLLANSHRLRHEHSSLVGDADFLQVGLRIEIGTHTVSELLIELLDVQPPE